MNAIKVVENTFKNNSVRAFEESGIAWFVASDISKALGYAQAKDMTRMLDEDEKGRRLVPTMSGSQEMVTINESGMYHALIKSRKPEAKPFRKWVTGEVLPAIRKTGSYTLPTTLTPAQKRDIQEAVAKTGKFRTIYSAIKSQFRVATYSELPTDRFEEVMAFIRQWVVEDKAPALKGEQFHYPAETAMPYEPFNRVLNYKELTDERRASPLKGLLSDVRRNGNNIDGAIIEMGAMLHLLEIQHNRLKSIAQDAIETASRGLNYSEGYAR